jgi:hypothetical protein
MENKSLDQLPFAEFSKLLHTKFRVLLGSEAFLDLELVEAKHFGSGSEGWAPGGAPTEAFSLFLDGPMKPVLPQSIYNVSHPDLGELSLFLVPVARTKTGIQYEVAFNRIAPATAGKS